MKAVFVIEEVNTNCFLQQGKYREVPLWGSSLCSAREFKTYEEAEAVLNTEEKDNRWTEYNYFSDFGVYAIRKIYGRMFE